jgi:hypothetical protein
MSSIPSFYETLLPQHAPLFMTICITPLAPLSITTGKGRELARGCHHDTNGKESPGWPRQIDQGSGWSRPIVSSLASY